MQAKLDLNHGFSIKSGFLCESIFAGEFGRWEGAGLNQVFLFIRFSYIIYN